MFDKEIYNCFSDLHVFNFKSLAKKQKKMTFFMFSNIVQRIKKKNECALRIFNIMFFVFFPPFLAV